MQITVRPPRETSALPQYRHRGRLRQSSHLHCHGTARVGRREPPLRTAWGGRSGSIPCSLSCARVSAMRCWRGSASTMTRSSLSRSWERGCFCCRRSWTEFRSSSVASAMSEPAARGRGQGGRQAGLQRVSPSRRIVQQSVARLFSSLRRLGLWCAICATRLSPVGTPAGSRALVSSAPWPGRFACRPRRNKETGCRCRGRARGRRER